MLEQIRAAQSAFNAGDYETAFAGLAPDVEWHFGDWVIDGGGVAHGHQELIDFYSSTPDAGEWQVHVKGVEEPGDRLLLVHQHGTATFRTTGLVFDQDFFQLYELGPNGVTRVREYATRDEALAAAAVL